MKLVFSRITKEKFEQIPVSERDMQTVYVVDNGDLWIMNTNMGNDFRVVDTLPESPSEDVGYTVKSTKKQYFYSEGAWHQIVGKTDSATDAEVTAMLNEVFGEEN